ncbi:hypothetical protein ELI_02540 [Erythrobacter litoralis HTCC2594]|uniref:Uncharacterized protein n=1 Tax=Erythrobacter litoralis (strain HTCC2594) TaxID=314225 RepID=Q2NCJ1_ERYLH|nr:hypothetical protein ELI_02540 [Erythrobacter litoralis HTCC2594]
MIVPPSWQDPLRKLLSTKFDGNLPVVLDHGRKFSHNLFGMLTEFLLVKLGERSREIIGPEIILPFAFGCPRIRMRRKTAVEILRKQSTRNFSIL